jgi:hypothetical protein
MTLSMYQASVPVFVRALGNLRHVLQKGEAFAAGKGIAPEVLLQTRLIPDMLPLVNQVRIATDMATRGTARLAGAEPTPVADEETTFAELYARIDGSESRPITLQMRTGELKFDGQSYLLHFLLPNLFFHTTTTYDILRQGGVPLGKTDFIGGAQ